MTNYVVKYSPNGKPDTIFDGVRSIPIEPKNADFQRFLIWNTAQQPPLDYTTPIIPAEIPASLEERIRALEIGFSPIKGDARTK